MQEPLTTLYDHWMKPTIGVIGAVAAGFYLGAHWVGSKAGSYYVLDQPEWVEPVQSTLWIVLALVAICTVGWILLDYRDHA